MNRDSLVSINIVNSKSGLLFNKNKFVPILYYWNGEGNLLNNILSDKEFKEKYLSNMNYQDYCELSIAYFYFYIDDDNDEKYIENIISIKDALSIDEIDSNKIYEDILLSKLMILYKKCNNKDFVIVNNDKLEDIKIIYSFLKDKYKEKISNKTICNWIRKELIDENNFVNDEINIIINNISLILNQK